MDTNEPSVDQDEVPEIIQGLALGDNSCWRRVGAEDSSQVNAALKEISEPLGPMIKKYICIHEIILEIE